VNARRGDRGKGTEGAEEVTKKRGKGHGKDQREEQKSQRRNKTKRRLYFLTTLSTNTNSLSTTSYAAQNVPKAGFGREERSKALSRALIYQYKGPDTFQESTLRRKAFRRRLT